MHFSNIEKVISICNEYFERDLSNDQINAWAATALLRKGEIEQAAAVLRRIRSLFDFPIWNAFKIAYLFVKAGLVQEGLRFLFEIRRHYYDDSKAHSLYLTTYLQIGIEEKLNLSSVEVDSSVTVETEHGTTTFTIEDRDDTISSHGELKLSNPVAQKLLGKSVGDVVTLNDNFGISLVCTIVNIVHKHVYAHRKSQELLSTVFAAESDLKVITIQGKTDEERGQYIRSMLSAQIEQANAQGKAVIEGYKSGIFPIGGLANFRGDNYVEIWAGVTNDHDMGLFNGLVGDLNDLQDKYTNNTSLVLDISSILTLNALKLFGFYEKIGCRLIVGRQCVDSLNAYIESLKIGDGPRITIAKDGEEFVRFEMSKEKIDQQIKIVEGIIAWTSENCDILSSSGIVNLESEYREELAFMLGETTLESILIAKENNSLFVAEEACVRLTALQQFSISSLNTQYLLRFNIESLIGRNEYDTYSQGLLRLNYKGILIDAQLLIYLAKTSDFSLSDDFILATHVLTGKVSNENSIMVATDFLLLLYLENAEIVKLTAIVVHTFECIFKDRDFALVALLLNKTIQVVFANAQKQQYHLVSTLYDFITDKLNSDEEKNS
jgi:hypothetical protein